MQMSESAYDSGSPDQVVVHVIPPWTLMEERDDIADALRSDMGSNVLEEQRHPSVEDSDDSGHLGKQDDHVPLRSSRVFAWYKSPPWILLVVSVSRHLRELRNCGAAGMVLTCTECYTRKIVSYLWLVTVNES